MRDRKTRLFSWLLVWSQLAVLAGCHHTIDGSGGSGSASVIAGILGNNDLGEVVFTVYRGQLAQEPDPALRDAQTRALDSEHDTFVKAVDDVLNVRTLGNAGQSIEPLFKLVDDDTIPHMAEDSAQILELLAQDSNALNALADLTRQRGATSATPPIDDVVALLGRMANYPDTEKLWTASAELLQNNKPLVNDGLALASRELKAIPPGTNLAPTGSIATLIERIQKTLLDEARLRTRFDFGAPEWLVRLDGGLVPVVALDPRTGRVPPPFVDDGTGKAKIDALGKFVDAQGAAIDLPPFDDPKKPGRDAYGRAISSKGDTVYVYFDAKKTHLALGAKTLGDLLRRDADVHGIAVLQAALGPQRPDKSYDPDAPIVDLAWGGLEVLATDEAPKTLRAVSNLLDTDPARAERVLVEFSRAVDKLKAAHAASVNAGGLGALPLSDPRIVKLTDDVLPIADGLCTQPASGGASTLRTLFDVMNDLQKTAPDWPTRMAPLFTNHRIQPLVPVDYTRPSQGTFDNRSSVQQLLSLLARADKCKLPFTSKSLAVQIIEMMAGMSPSTVATLTSLVTSLPGFLTNLACPGISNDIASLDDMAKSGSLDAFLPIAKAFKDRGEVPLLIELLVRLDQDYDQVLRPSEPDLGRVMSSGAVEELCGILGETTTITDPQTGARSADVIADAIANLVNQHSSHYVDRKGQPVPSLAHLLLRPLQKLDAQMRAANVQAHEQALLDACYAVALERVTVNGQEQLANETLVPFLAKAFDDMAASIPADPAQRRAEVTRAQQSVATSLTSSTTGTLVSIEAAIINSPQKRVIDAAIVNMLTPNKTVKDDIFGAVVKLAAYSFQLGGQNAGPPQASLTDLLRFAGDAIDPKRPVVQDMVQGITKILTQDQGKTLLTLYRAALNPAPGETRAPAAIILHVTQDVQDARRAAGGNAAPMTSNEVRDQVLKAIAFIRDKQQGLGYFFAMVKQRQHP